MKTGAAGSDGAGLVADLLGGFLLELAFFHFRLITTSLSASGRFIFQIFSSQVLELGCVQPEQFLRESNCAIHYLIYPSAKSLIFSEIAWRV